MARPRVPLGVRLFRLVRKTKRCWIWLGQLNADGYGMIHKGHGRGSGNYLVHRASWMIHKGPIPKGLKVLHDCDNRRCVNPKHLWLGTTRDNNRDMARKRRQAVGPATRRNKLSIADVSIIRQLLKTGLLNHVQIARAFKVCRETIWEIANGKSWKGYASYDPSK